MKRISLFCLVAFSAGCSGDLVEEFRSASPSRQGISINVPQSQALTSANSGELKGVLPKNANENNIARREVLGQTAEFYQFTVTVSSFVNGAVVSVLNLVEDIIDNPPTSIDNSQAEWGPYTAPLSPITAKFIMTSNNGVYSYVLQGKPKNQSDSAYLSVLTGQHQPSGQNAGQGTFVLNLGASGTLNSDPTQQGTVSVQYAKDTSGNLAVVASFQGVYDQSSGQLVDATYEFGQLAGGNGSFQFVLTKDFDGKGQLETLAVDSRWEQDGAGRSDILGSGGDLGSTQVQVTECWDMNFLETFYTDNLNINPTEGSASSCVFSNAQYSKL
jgi:hypothetical protein